MTVKELILRLQKHLEAHQDHEHAVEEYAVLIGDKYGTDVRSAAGGNPNLYDRLPSDVSVGCRRLIVILPEETFYDNPS